MTDSNLRSEEGTPVLRKHVVAIVVAHFDESLDYFETTAADVLSSEHVVHVITSTRRASTLRDGGLGALADFSPGVEVRGNLHIHRIRPVAAQGQRVIGRGVSGLLHAIRPDLIIQEAPSQFFPLPATRFARGSGTPLIYVSGENSQQGPQTGWRRVVKEAYWNSVVRAIIRYAVGAASMVVATTPETQDVIARADHKSSPVVIPLPFRSSKFFRDAPLGDLKRGEWAGPGDHVTMFVGRFDPTKDLLTVIQGWELFAKEREDAKLVLAGIADDAFSRGIARRCAESPFSERISLRPFAPASEVNGLLNAADVTVWPTVSIGIQQAAATGCFFLIPEGSTGSFLLDGEAQGLGASYGPADPDSLARALVIAASRSSEDHRIGRASIAARLYSDTAILVTITNPFLRQDRRI